MKKSREKKHWYTVGYVTREGTPAPGHGVGNFVRHYMQLSLLREDVVRVMSGPFARGAYAAVVWPGQVGQYEALHDPQVKPLFYVFEGGRVERL